MVDQDLSTDTFVEFATEVEPRLRHALSAAFGLELGRESTAHALAYGWEQWERVHKKDNAAGYLWGVGRNYARRELRPRPVFPVPRSDSIPWIEPGLPAALSHLTERQRVAVLLIHGLPGTFSEVADLLGVSKSTVQTQAERGMAKLRRQMGVLNAD